MTAIITALVDETEHVRIERGLDADRIVSRVQVAPGDVGKVIGNAGGTARSIRTIMGAVATKFKCATSVEIVDGLRN